MSNNNNLWWFALLLWAGGSTYWHVCKIKELCYAQSSSEPSSDSFPITPLSIKDGANLDLVSKGNFVFSKSGQNPVLTAVQPELDSLAGYLLSHPGRKIAIVGFYSADESAPPGYDNLGLARAEQVKAHLVGLGLPDSILVTNGELLQSIKFERDSLFGGIDFAFSGQLLTSEVELAKAEKFENVFKPMDLYFATGSSSYLKTEENRKFVEEAVRYLKANQGKQLILAGHTDNTGEEELNNVLSKRRAQAVKAEFVSSGIAGNQLAVEAKGELFPKASNDTESGRKANRRVEIVVK